MADEIHFNLLGIGEFVHFILEYHVGIFGDRTCNSHPFYNVIDRGL